MSEAVIQGLFQAGSEASYYELLVAVLFAGLWKRKEKEVNKA